MQEGIGRGGYRVLALVFFGLAALGLAIAAAALDPSGLFDWLGLVLAGLSVVALAAVAMLGFAPRAEADVDDEAELDVTMPEPISEPEPVPEPDPGVSAMEMFEPVTVEERMTGGPPPRPQPPPVPITQPRRVDLAKGGWPGRAEPTGVTRRQMHERNLPRDPGPTIEMDGPVAPVQRREPPVVMARTVASAEASGIPEGSSVGKCGNCGVLLVAPKKRPLRLQCPRCERVHTLG